MPVTLTRTVGFSAFHRYERLDWTPERNREAFGAATDLHGHEYTCSATVAGPIDLKLGMIMDLKELDRILQEEVVAPFHGKDLSRDLPAFAPGRMLPTCEAVASYVFERIAARLPTGVRLARVRVQEDPTLYADCTGTI